MKRTPLPPGSETRAAALLVTRFGMDRARIDRMIAGALAARAGGNSVDFLQLLIDQKDLTPAQADDVRRELTTNDASSVNGTAQHSVPVPETNPGSTPATEIGSREAPTTPSGNYLRSLGEYRLLRRLGQGGMGSVYLGYDESRKQHVAIKVLSEQLAGNHGYVERFYREAKSGALLDHPNIVRCIRAGLDKTAGKHYLVLEYIDGPSAHALLDRSGRLSVGDAVHIILDIAHGLEHVHSRNIVHRDIKPDNILITRSGVAKLADLGLAKRVDEVSNLTGLRVGFGTVDYIPYEQAINAKQADARSDVYALGATLYHLVTGEVPFPAKNYMAIAEKKLVGTFRTASELNPAVPPILDQILDTMLARDPADRYQMVSELIVDLERANLASPVPSFADPDLALQDPLVRERLARPAQPTQLDLQAKDKRKSLENGRSDFWFVRFRSGNGAWTKTKLTARQISERLDKGLLAGEVEACRHAQGEFRPLSDVPEFADFTIAKAKRMARRISDESVPAPSDATPSEQPSLGRRWFLPLILGFFLIVLVLVAIVFFR